MNKRNYILYKHTNIINNKIYIGITCQEPKKRWLNGKGYTNNDYFRKTIKKYGWNNFTHEILYENLTKKEAEQKEIELISFYKSNQREYGYNIQNGGNSIGKHSDETKLKISEANKGNKSWNKGIHYGFGEDNNFYNKHHTEETKRKISVANKGRKKTQEQIEKIRKSCKKTWEEKIKNGYTVSIETRKKLSNSLKGRESTFKGKHHTEETKRKISESHIGKSNQKVIEKLAEINSIPILCFDKNNNFIKEYKSSSEASKDLNICASNIPRCLKNYKYSCKGYKFKYKEDENEK